MCVKDTKKAQELCERAAARGQEKARAMLQSLQVSPGAEGASSKRLANDKVSKAKPELQAGRSLHDAHDVSRQIAQVLELLEGLRRSNAPQEQVRQYEEVLANLELMSSG